MTFLQSRCTKTLTARWQSGYAADCKSAYTGSTPVRASIVLLRFVIFMPVQSIIAKTLEYLQIPCVVGHEVVFMNHLANEFGALGAQVSWEKGLLAVHGSQPHSSIISAHIDRHGLISLGGGEYFYAAQFIKEIKYGISNEGAQRELRLVANRFEGEDVLAYDSSTGEILGHGRINHHSPCKRRGDGLFYIDGMPDVPQDTPVAYAKEPEDTGKYLMGQIDNTLSIAAVYELFKNGYQGTALLTAEEEIGKSWAHISRCLDAHDIQTDRLIVLDTSPYSGDDRKTVIDGTVVLRGRDKSAVFNTDLVKTLAKTCEDLALPYQIKDMYLLAQGKEIDELGSTELGKLILRTDGRWNGATIQVPTTMYHTSNETTSHIAIEHYYRMLEGVLMNGAEGS